MRGALALRWGRGAGGRQQGAQMTHPVQWAAEREALGASLGSVVGAQEGADQGRKPLGRRQKPARGFRSHWFQPGAPSDWQPPSLLCAQCPLSHSSKQKGHLCPACVGRAEGDGEMCVEMVA